MICLQLEPALYVHMGKLPLGFKHFNLSAFPKTGRQVNTSYYLDLYAYNKHTFMLHQCNYTKPGT